jgi:hypothetical protein
MRYSRVAVALLQLCSNKFEVDEAIDQAQQMIFRNLIFEAEVVEQRLRAGLVSHHEQQTSERNDEQQHRELWPAYNPNVVLPQASIEGLFQQTRLLSPTAPDCHFWQLLLAYSWITVKNLYSF